MSFSTTWYSRCFLYRFRYDDNDSIDSAVTVKLLFDLPLCEIIDSGNGQLWISSSDEKLYVVVADMYVAVCCMQYALLYN